MPPTNTSPSTLLSPKPDRYREVTIKISRIGNGYQVTELSDNIPYAYYELGLGDTVSPKSHSPCTTVTEHIARFFARLEGDVIG